MRYRSCNTPWISICGVDTQALTKWDFRVESMSPKQVAQDFLATHFSHPSPLARLHAPDQFFPFAVESYKTYLPSIRLDYFDHMFHEPVVLTSTVDERENYVNSLFRSFL